MLTGATRAAPIEAFVFGLARRRRCASAIAAVHDGLELALGARRRANRVQTSTSLVSMNRPALLATALALLVVGGAGVWLGRRVEHGASLERARSSSERASSHASGASAAVSTVATRVLGIATADLEVLVEGCVDPAWGETTLVVRTKSASEDSNGSSARSASNAPSTWSDSSLSNDSSSSRTSNSSDEVVVARVAIRDAGLVRLGRVPLQDLAVRLESEEGGVVASRDAARAQWERGPLALSLSTVWHAGVRFVDSSGRRVELPAAGGIFARQNAAPRVVPWTGRTPERAPASAFDADGAATTAFGSFRRLASSRFDVECNRAGCAGIVEFRACAPVDVLVLVGTAVVGRATIERVAPTIDVHLDGSVLAHAYGSVRGEVRARGGALHDTGFEGVAIQESAQRRATLLAKWDADGRFEVASLAPGRCWLSIRAAGRVQHLREIEVPRGGVLDVGVVELVEGAAIVGRIVDEAGRPVATRVWTASLASSGRDRWIGSHPDVQGEESFYVLDLPREVVLVGIDDERFAANPERFDLSAGDARDVVLVARSGVRVEFTSSRAIGAAADVRIVDASGVEVLVLRGAELGARPSRLVPGRYTARISRPDGAELVSPFEVAQSDTQVDLDVR